VSNDIKNETDLFKKARAAGRTAEEIKADYERGVTEGRVKKFGLPVHMQNSDGSVKLRGRDAQIVTPDAAQVRQFADMAPRKVCGDCKHFDLEKGREEIIKQRFAEKLVNDYEWALRHLGGPVDTVGLCGMSGGSMACLVTSPACEQHKPKRG
jgi:hypothetical protein